jgi:hypothetical protein
VPDPLKQTLSATQTPALLNASPYFTRWMLWHHFANGMDLGAEENDRIREGRRMQPLVLERAAQELRLAVEQNESNAYVRNGQLGANRDATIICPDRGPGALETKCCFDYAVWMAEWDGGKRVPPHVEIQLQQQMLVGDGEKSFEWGVITVWVAATQHYFERSPQLGLWKRLTDEAADFFMSLYAKVEPDPFGLTIEMGWLEELYPTVPHKTLDLRDDEDAERLTRKASTLLRAKANETANKKVYDALRSEFRAVAKDNETILLPGNAVVRFGARGRIKVTVPGAEETEDDD